MASSDIILKILTLGESSVGKSSIIRRFTNNKFNEQFLTTVGVDFKSKIISYKNKKVKVLLVDTSGQDRFRNIANNYYRSADGILLVFDVSKRISIEKFDLWIQQINEKWSADNNSILLFGNKIDCVNDREISNEEGKQLAEKYKMAYIEGSALTGEGINEGIELLVDKIIKHKRLLEDEESNLSTTIHLKYKSKKKYTKEEEEKVNAKCC
jgi:small GTP-binding protein